MCEAEYQVLAAAVHTAIFLRGRLKELLYEQCETTIGEDNKGWLQIASN